MPTLYSASSSQWPLLQSKTEQKFKSGLLNVSAEFIRPVGNTELPLFIDSSIGAVEVWPYPTISRGTDGFERINATGYGLWDPGHSESTFGYELGVLSATFTIIDMCDLNDGCGDGRACGSILSVTPFFKEMEVILETVHIVKNGSGIPVSPPLNVFITNGGALPSSMNVSSFFPINSVSHDGKFDADVNIVQRLVNVKKNIFGSTQETEVIYKPVVFLDFGTFTKKTNCPP